MKTGTEKTGIEYLAQHSTSDLINEIRKAVNEVMKETFSEYLTKAESDLINHKQAAELLYVTTVTLLTYRRKGLIPFVTVGRSIKYKKSDLQEYLQTRKR